MPHFGQLVWRPARLSDARSLLAQDGQVMETDMDKPSQRTYFSMADREASRMFLRQNLQIADAHKSIKMVEYIQQT